jgi:nucleotide-binding universal stress UspA family protein
MKKKAIYPFATYPDAPSDGSAALVVAAAGELDADLHALAVNVDIPDVANAFSRLLIDVPEMIRAAEATGRRNAERMFATLASSAMQRGLQLTTETLAGEPADMTDVGARRARYFDLVVAAAEAGNATTRAMIEALVFETGRPVLILPPSGLGEGKRRVAIAWDGSRVAARAVADAMPLLAAAERVHVLTVTDEKPLHAQAGRLLAEGLRDRGIAAEASTVEAEDRPIGATLQDDALALGAGLLVMGGYGHSRLRDFVLGGATLGVLDDPRMPVLMSH